MILKLKKLNYKYILFLSLANKDIRITKIEKFINDRVNEFNIYSRTSTKNKKVISDWKIDEKEDLLIITLESENPLPIPVRGIKYFVMLLINTLKKEDIALHDEILKKKAFFRTVDIDVQEVNSLKNDVNIKEEIEEGEKINILKNDINVVEEIEESNINLMELKKLKLREEIIGLLITSNISAEELENIKGILKKGMV